jgi:hypothetical protein
MCFLSLYKWADRDALFWDGSKRDQPCPSTLGHTSHPQRRYVRLDLFLFFRASPCWSASEVKTEWGPRLWLDEVYNPILFGLYSNLLPFDRERLISLGGGERGQQYAQPHISHQGSIPVITVAVAESHKESS